MFSCFAGDWERHKNWYECHTSDIPTLALSSFTNTYRLFNKYLETSYRL